MSDEDNFFDRICDTINQRPGTQQLLCGVISGTITGFLSMKIGKTLAFSIGGGIIIIYILNESGYLEIDWGSLRNRASRMRGAVGERMAQENFQDKVLRIAKMSTAFSVGFVGGFFIGLSFG